MLDVFDVAKVLAVTLDHSCTAIGMQSCFKEYGILMTWAEGPFGKGLQNYII